MCRRLTVASLTVAFGTLLALSRGALADAQTVEIPADVLADKIAGGLLGQLLGNLNGLPHENKYIAAPGQVRDYTPSLPEGAWTDDDTDIEWVYIVEMQGSGEILLPPQRIVDLWRQHINKRIWCSNRYARDLMDLGIAPPLTGRSELNPWAEFNIGGQFLCECFGLVAPGMPQTASRVGLHYTHVAIDGEPAQATQLCATMIAVAFIESDVSKIVAAGRDAVDPRSEIYRVVGDVLAWWKAAPEDWQKTRQRIRERYTRHGGELRDRNGCALNTAAVIGALLYGKGDFVETLRLAFNFGWDADCNAATAGTVIGVIKGRQWMLDQKWIITDRYENRSRPGMPTDETITRFSERLADVARKVILSHGGGIRNGTGEVLRIRSEAPANVEPLTKPENRLTELRRRLLPGIEKDLAGERQDRARAVYLALCLGEAHRLSKERPDQWRAGVKALNGFPKVVHNIIKAPSPWAVASQARAAGLQTRPAR